jgi:hypothetical protein
MLVGLAVSGAAAQSSTYTCADGSNFNDPVIVRWLAAPGTYTVTAFGIDGFDPKLAIVDEADAEIGCIDDTSEAGAYTLALPTVGALDGSLFNAQLTFTHDGSDPRAYAIYVGGFGDTLGAFALTIEGGMLNAMPTLGGDPFSIVVTPSMRAVYAGISAYMVDADGEIDPLIEYVDENGVVMTREGVNMACDDAGSMLCYGESVPLTDAALTVATPITADTFDSMLSIPFSANDWTEGEDGYANFIFTTFGRTSTGAYVAAFHFQVESGTGQPIAWSEDARSLGSEVGMTFVVTCPGDGTFGSLWGTDVYTNDSSVCTAAVHAGVITQADGGTFVVTLSEGLDSYKSTSRNGVTSSTYGFWNGSFSVAPIQ